jgi:hypothetical protein
VTSLVRKLATKQWKINRRDSEMKRFIESGHKYSS